MSSKVLIEDHTYLRNVCIFCYEAEVRTRKEDFKIINQFLNILERCEEDNGVDRKQFSVHKENFQKSCCVGCLGLLKSFCDIYHQLKCLEMHMDWKLISLVNIMKFADRVPSRLKTLQSVGTPIPTLKLKSFRELVITKSHRRLYKSQPRVVLKRIPKRLSPTGRSLENVTVDGLSLDSNIEMDDPDDNYGQDGHEIPLEMDLDNVKETFFDPLGDIPDKADSKQTEQSCQVEMISIKQEESPADNDNLIEIGELILKEEIPESFHLEQEDPPWIPSPTTLQISPPHISPGIPSPSIKITHVRSIDKTKILKRKRIRGKEKSSESTPPPMSLKTQSPPIKIISIRSKKKTAISKRKPILGGGKSSAQGYHCGLCNFSTNNYDNLRTHKRSMQHQNRQKLHLRREKIIKIEATCEATVMGGTPPLSINPDFNSKSKPKDLKRCTLDGCSRAFNTEKHRKLHSLGTFHCHFCEAVEDNVIRLSVHELNEHSSNPNDKDPLTLVKIYHCPRCSYDTKTLHHYKSHFAAAHIPGFENIDKLKQADKILCEICQLNILKRRSKIHFKAMHDKTGVDPSDIRKCKYDGCPAYFVWRSVNASILYLQMGKHRRKVHGRDRENERSQKNLPCPDVNCLETFGTHEDLEAHGKLHGNFQCSFCEVVKTFSPGLALHESENHVPKCSKTGGSSKSGKNIKKEWNCVRCPCRFSNHRKEYINHFLTKHLKIRSLNSNEKKKCSVCNAESETNCKTFLKTHYKRCHDTEGLDPSEIHRCPLCPAYFIKAAQLHKHNMKMHFKNKCPECGISFTSRSTRKRHMEREHPNCSAFFETRVIRAKASKRESSGNGTGMERTTGNGGTF